MSASLDLFDNKHFGTVVPWVTNLLTKGESVVVWGMPGYGRKHFLRLMERKLGMGNNFKTIFIECLANTIDTQKVLNECICNLINLDSREIDYIKLATYLKNNKLIVILGHIEEVSNKAELFSTLQKIREVCIDNFAVLSSCDQTIITKKIDYLDAGGILFANIMRMPLFDLKGTKRILEINQDYFGYKVPDEATKEVYRLSGGNPALIKHLGKFVSEMGEKALNNLEFMINYPSLEIKLESVAKVIISEDRTVLEKMGIIDTGGQLFSPLVGYYLKGYEIENQKMLLPELSPREGKIFLFLLANRGTLVTKDRIGFLMNLTDDNFSMWAIYKTISRLKIRLRDKYEIKAVKDKGYVIT